MSTSTLFVRFFAATLVVSMPVDHLAAKAIGSFLPDGDVADAPAGYEDMCARDTVLCNVGASATSDVTIIEPSPLLISKSYGVTSEVAPTATLATDGTGCAKSWLTASALSGSAALTSVVFQPLILTQKNAFSDLAVPANTAMFQSCGAKDTADWNRPLAPVYRPYATPIRSNSNTAEDTITKNPALQKKMIRWVNAVVNHDVIQMSDMESVGVEERWQRPTPGRYLIGDCEDLAIEKRMRLIEAGFPSDRLFLVVAYLGSFELHTVLVARLDSGDYVLDSLKRRVLPWAQVHYSWIRQQTIGQPHVWRTVGTPQSGRQMVEKKRRPTEVASS